MAKTIVGIGINVELAIGAKYDRFQPYVSIEVDTASDKSVDAQIDEATTAARKSWERVSNLIEEMSTHELNRVIKVGEP